MNRPLARKFAYLSPALIAVLVVFALPSTDYGLVHLTSIESDNVPFKGVFTVTHRDAEGEIIRQFNGENLIPNEGLECISDLMFGTTECTGETVFSYIALGTSGTAPVDGDTVLNAEDITCVRVGDAAVATNTGTTGERIFTISSIFSGASCEGTAFLETGVFDRSCGECVSGNLLATLTFTSITLASGETLTIDYNIKVESI